MSYSVITDQLALAEGEIRYSTAYRSCEGHDPVFQQWLRDNADNLPADIQAKVDAGELTIQDADD